MEMRLTDETIQEDDKRFKRQNLLAEFNYCGKYVPHRKSITNDDIRFYAWLCRSAYALLKEQEAVEPHYTTLRYFANGKEVAVQHPECPRCIKNGLVLFGAEIEKGQAYCKRCGQAMKWK